MQSYIRYLLIVCWIVVLSVPARAFQTALTVPELHRHVTDLSGTLSPGDLDDLDSRLATFEKQTSNQIVILMIPSLQDEALEDYSMRVAEKNKIGKKDRNNGVLILVAKDDHKMRIETGYGLEGALTDAVSSQIIRNEITPRFRTGDYAGGLRAAADAIEKVTKGEYTADEDNGGRNNRRGRLTPGFLVFIIFLFSFIMRIFRRTGHYVGSRGYVSRGPWWWGGGGYGGGGFGSGGFGGGGFGGGGGFSGGGGSFGGGGSSGGW